MNKKISLAIAVLVALTGCSADDGKDGTNGNNGIDGTSGFSSLISQQPLNVGNVNCRNGGVQINSGLDANQNNVLDGDEISNSEFVCNAIKTSLTSNDITQNSKSAWYGAAENQINSNKQQVINANNELGKAKNIILFVGDGMGISTITAARILAGQKQGLLGEEYQLSFDKMPFSGFVKTYNVDAQTPDSAGTMSAIMSGVKTDMGVIGVGADVVRGDCASMQGNKLVTALELAEIAGKATGIVTTARITHATPAATYAHSPERNWEDVSDMPASAVTAGCEDIASQLVNFEANLESRFNGINVNGLEVVMGGGRRHFLPKDAAFNSSDATSAIEGDRTDNRDLTAEWQAQYPQGNYVMDQTSFDAINPETTSHLLGLFNESHMQYEADRANDVAGEPSLSAMTDKAIKILDNNAKGFFLMVESGRIDHAHHAGNAANALNETIEFAKAIEKAVANTNPEETLILVTADHSHVFTIAGYPKRGNPILGKVVAVGKTEASLAADDMPYTTLGYTNGRGFKDLGSQTNADAGYAEAIVTGRVDLTNVDTTTIGFHQEALVPRSSETHAGEDVGVYASGPSSQLVRGTNEQSYLFHVMTHAANLVAKAEVAVQ
ncbi:MAG: alkaline phosphatase [Alteromonadaceae bacterium]|nr:alkaline phosphatase [Alteromonadaceae bacterium]